jgi:multidrug efflux pump subunit AcrA (membrane-fusion protein)
MEDVHEKEYTMECNYYHHMHMSDVIPQPKRKRWYKRWWFWMLLVLVGLTATAMIAGSAAWNAKKIASFDYLNDSVVVTKRDLQKTISTTGTIVPDAVATLSVAGTATVTEVKVAVGQTVKKDDVLIALNVDIPGTPTELKATFDGRVIALGTFVGDRVSPAVPLIELGYATNHIEFYASDSEVIELKPNQTVVTTIPSYEGGKATFSGTVTFVDVKKQQPQISNCENPM